MRSEKIHLVNYIAGLISESDYVYFISYVGLTVKELTELRSQLCDAGDQVHILKNTLIRKAGEKLGLEAFASIELKQDTALVCGKGDAGAAAKVIVEFGKKIDKVSPKGGFFEGAALTVSEVKDIASLPPKPVLQAQLLSVLQGPSRQLVTLLNAKAATILNVLNAYKEKLEQ